jgi:hypothetical protein
MRGVNGVATMVLAMILAAPIASAQSAGADRATPSRAAERAAERAADRRDARRAAAGADDQDPTNRAFLERQRVETSLREALAQVVKQRLNLSDDQTSKLLDVNRRFSEDRLRVTRDEIRIRRELRRSLNGRAGDADRSPETARLLDDLLNVQQQRLDLQQKEQSALSEFMTPEQRARFIGMMEQLRRRIQVRADSARAQVTPPE